MITPYNTTEEDKAKLPAIASIMRQQFTEEFIKDCINIAEEYGGMYDLLYLWINETDVREKTLLALDIKKTVDEIKGFKYA